MKIVEYKARGYYGKKVNVPAKYDEKARGLIKDVIKLGSDEEIPTLLEKHGYTDQIDIVYDVNELFSYKILKNRPGEEGELFSKVRFRELKDTLYLNVCLYGANKIHTEKTRKIKRQSEEKMLKIKKERQRIQEHIKRILRDD